VEKQKKLTPVNTSKKEEPVFDRPTPYGWYTVVFPPITSETRPLDLWIDELLQHLRAKGITTFSWSYLHGMPRKFDDVLSPVFYFKNRMDAKHVEWRFSGETLEGAGCV
jgi:hypothetical protein